MSEVTPDRFKLILDALYTAHRRSIFWADAVALAMELSDPDLVDRLVAAGGIAEILGEKSA